MSAFILDTSGAIYFATPYAKAHGLKTFYRWSDLSPFEQGYVEGLFASAEELRGLLIDLKHRINGRADIWSIGDARHYRQMHEVGLVSIVKPSGPAKDGALPYLGAKLRAAGRGRAERPFAFSDLHPETLRTIRRDCADFVSDCYPADRDPTKDDGRAFWEGRQAGKPAVRKMPIESGLRLGLKHFPPLSVALDDAGKVVFA